MSYYTPLLECAKKHEEARHRAYVFRKNLGYSNFELFCRQHNTNIDQVIQGLLVPTGIPSEDIDLMMFQKYGYLYNPIARGVNSRYRMVGRNTIMEFE